MAWSSSGLCQAFEPLRGSLGSPTDSPVAFHFDMEYAVPQVHKWYGPRHLLESNLRPWYAVDTRYAKEQYTRYVSSLLEGDDFYDLLGNPIGRGWLVYSWTQAQPEPRGSDIIKTPIRAVRTSSQAGLGFGAYAGFFNRLVVSTDGAGGGIYRLMVGDEIHTFFTPLTFYKPRFNGVRLDYAEDRYGATLLLSRPSDPDGKPPADVKPFPGAGEQTNATHLTGGHVDFQAGEPMRMGFTYLSTRNADTQLDLNNGNPLNGTLTTRQNRPLSKLWVRLRDDSPVDQSGGAALLAYDIVLVDTSGLELRGSEIGFEPGIEGGVARAGALVADGGESIVLEYDMAALNYEGIRSADLRQARVELTLADDYRIESSSDLQTDGQGNIASAIFLPVQRAAGNVRDKSNTRVVAVEYGLPVASEILGFDWNLVEWNGLSMQGEAALNRRFSRYPNPAIKKHHQTIDQASALYVQAAYVRFPWTLFGEGFSIEDGYGTSYWLTTSSGTVKYASPIPQLYELVDDDDDRDSSPEWVRPYQPADPIAWPGYDENRDFINDHNQNGNLIPDYEEPFLRFRSDRPEFLFGLDMNHNGTIDRFENDDLPDYPYKKDHRGFNLYAKGNVGPDASLTFGHQRVELISGDGHTHSWYLLGAWQHRLRGGGRLRVFDFGGLVEDDIPDDLITWYQPIDAQGRMQEEPDWLSAQNSWKNSLYADLEQRWGSGIRLQHRFKWELLVQRDGAAELEAREGRATSGFLGLIDRAEWSIPVGLAVLQPRWKSEYRRDRPYSTRLPAATSVEQTFLLLWTQPLLAEQVGVSYFPRYGRQMFNTKVQLGLEVSRFWLLEGERQEIDQDFSRWTGIVQLTNRSAYEGYQVITRTGVRVGQWNFDHRRRQRTSTFFMTVNAGLKG
ncbi:MAG: hypothetical protein HOC74_37265 [Gemmatimonadetes bacterium]|nr:hypothetical protein [Gemmatimonadota bacterium]